MKKGSYQKCLINEDVSIQETIRLIEKHKLKIVLVVDNSNHLIGTVTDGDIRRGILGGKSSDESIKTIANRNPFVVPNHLPDSEIINIMLSRSMYKIPVVDKDGTVCGLKLIDELIAQKEKTLPNYAVIMAGGLGTRLHPLTSEVPKPLLTIGQKPVLHIIVGQLASFGFRNILISINYKAEMIETYFQSGQYFGVNINYLRESKQLGTAGALSLINDDKFLKEPVLVMNGDILTGIDFASLLEHHGKHKHDITVCVRRHEFQIPYGVVDLKGTKISNIEEKPMKEFFISAGIYIINPSLIKEIPSNTYFNMTDLIKSALKEGKVVRPFPIMEYWLDIGRLFDYEKAIVDRLGFVESGNEENR